VTTGVSTIDSTWEEAGGVLPDAAPAGAVGKTLYARITASAAFRGHTRGAWRCVGEYRSGSIEIGAPAHLAAWSVTDLEVRVPDERVQGWSTDPRSATPGLPALDGPDPRCLATWVDGDVVFGEDFVEAQRG